MKFYILASGSAGNCTIFENDNHQLLMIDCGLSYIEIQRRMNSVGLNINDVKALLVTHLHNDHCLSLKAFSNDIIYMNIATGMSEYHLFDYYQTLNILDYEIYTLPASHDSPGTTGFIIKHNNEKLAYLTDTGYIHENIQRMINNCDQYLIESNHDPRMLMLTKRPLYLKNRILSPNGHMSNKDCAVVLGNVIGPSTKEIVFIHRSREANSEEMIVSTFNETMKQMDVDVSNIKISIAKQDSVIESQLVKVS